MVRDSDEFRVLGHDFAAHFRSEQQLSQLIIELRERALDKLCVSNVNVCHLDDLDRIRNDDWFLRRFLHEYYSEGSDLNQIVDKLFAALSWRHEFRVNDMRAEEFPRELFEANIFAGLARDEDPTVYIFVDCKKLRNIKGWTDVLYKFAIHNMLTIFARMEDRNAVMILDSVGIGLEQIQVGLTLAQMVLTNFPGSVSLVQVMDLPFLVKVAANMIMSVFAIYRTQFEFISRKEALKIHGPQNIPPSMGGQSEDIETTAELCPEAAPTLEEFACEQDIPVSSAKKLREVLKL